jgi:energy-coupling factor transporter transmembrane protein EcfT
MRLFLKIVAGLLIGYFANWFIYPVAQTAGGGQKNTNLQILIDRFKWYFSDSGGRNALKNDLIRLGLAVSGLYFILKIFK